MDDARLSLDQIDIEALVLARNDDHPEGNWWFDPRTGRSLYYGTDDDADLPELVDGVHVLIPASPQPRSDIDDFFAVADRLGVADEVIMDLYDSYRGSGGQRRFRDRVGSSGAAEAWRDFTVLRETQRAVDWLRERGLIADD